MQQIAKGIQKITFGTPEQYTPEYFRQFSIKKEEIEQIPVSRSSGITEDQIHWKKTKRGITVTLPMETREDIYGFGLQLQGFNQAGRRRYIKVNSDPVANTGESHAPVPFYISSAGYGLFVNTFRYTTFLCGTNSEKGQSAGMTSENEPHEEFSEAAIYALKRAKEERKVIIDIPAAEGVELYLFEGNIPEVVQRYNLFSGGGCVPPMWGLGMWYRIYGGSDEKTLEKLAEQFRDEKIPMDVLGLEPGWHSHSYSCTYKWSYLFPHPDEMIEKMSEQGYRLNLWEHLYVYPKAPFYKELMPYSGDYEVWNGLIPDFATKEASKLFENYHRDTFVKKGIAGFKLDECDNSDYNPSNWAFPDSTEFPSGMDGEQMHLAIGTLYQNLIYRIYRQENRRTYSQVRSSGALAAPLPFVLYSDLYDHKQFIRGVVNSGFSGLLWCPEVRDCANGDDLLRRLQTVVFSAHALINSWRIPSPPWKQTDIEKNLAGETMDTATYYTEECRKLFALRMSLLPYLYSAFVEYSHTGKPPIRALVLDYPEDMEARMVDDEYLFGDSMLVCPLTYEDGTSRKVYLPQGRWYNFFTGEEAEGGQMFEIHAAYDEIPVFVKDGAMIPVANPVLHIDKDTVFEMTVKIFGEADGRFVLYEDDFDTFAYEEKQKQIVIEKHPGSELTIQAESGKMSRYRFVK
jgi:alpha-D-xyloside xylohydrolase